MLSSAFTASFTFLQTHPVKFNEKVTQNATGGSLLGAPEEALLHSAAYPTRACFQTDKPDVCQTQQGCLFSTLSRTSPGMSLLERPCYLK